VPVDLTNGMAIAAGGAHSVALRNDGTVLAWGNNSAGQTNLPADGGAVKLIAAGGDFTLMSRFSPLVQYAVEVTKDLLLIYNSNSTNSTVLKEYYLAHRPLVGGANVLPVACDVGEITTSNNCLSQIVMPVLGWLTNNPTKHPQYLVLFFDMPTRIENHTDEFPSVTYLLYSSYPGAAPFVNYINAGTLADCTNYVNKLADIGATYSPGKLIISASAAGATGYGNTNYYFDDTRIGYASPAPDRGDEARQGVLSANPFASVTYSNAVDNGLASHITCGTNLAGYFCWGIHSSLTGAYATNGNVRWYGSSRWWVVETVESSNGVRDTDHGNFVKWLSPSAFGGTDYSSTPVGAVTHVEEPGLQFVNIPSIYFGLWEAGKNFGICSWNSRTTTVYQAVGDPLVVK